MECEPVIQWKWNKVRFDFSPLFSCEIERSMINFVISRTLVRHKRTDLKQPTHSESLSSDFVNRTAQHLASIEAMFPLAFNATHSTAY